MNTLLRSFDPETLLFYDIETVRMNEELDVNSREFEMFQYKHRIKTTGELLEEGEVVETYKKNAALSPVYGKIVCISMAFIKGNSCYYKSLVGEEKDVIDSFMTAVEKMKPSLAGYNNLRFDGPFLRMRAQAVGAKLIPDKVNDSSRKPWELEKDVVDLMEHVRGSFMNPLSLDEACYLFGVESPKSDIGGAQVSDVFYSGDIQRIAKYCNGDVVACVKLFLKLTGREGLVTEWIDKSEGVEKKEETPQENLLGIIRADKQVTEASEEALMALAAKIKAPERKVLVRLVKAALARVIFTEEEEALFKAIQKGKK